MATIAQIYAEYKKKQDIEEFLPLLQNFGLSSEIETKELLQCLKLCRPEILEKANHRFFYELSLNVKYFLDNHEIFNYIAEKLNGPYSREYSITFTKTLIKKCFEALDKCWDDSYFSLDLQVIFLRSLEIRKEDPLDTNPFNTVHEEPEIEKKRKTYMAGVVNQLMEDINSLLDSERNMTDYDQRRLMQNSLLLCIRNDISSIVETASASNGPSLEERNLCKNKNVSVVTRWDGEKWETYYANNDVIKNLVFKKPEDENTCCICMDSVGHHHCGNHKNCKGYYCTKCYYKFAGRFKNQCAFCRQKLLSSGINISDQ